MKNEILLSVTRITDDDTGLYHIGEIDFAIHGRLTTYLEKYGIKGRDEIVRTLGFLIHKTYEEFDKILKTENKSEVAKCT